MKQLFLLLSALLAVSLFSSCGGSKTEPTEVELNEVESNGPAVERATQARRVYEAWQSVVDSRGTAETLIDLKENLADKQIYLDRWEMKYTDPAQIPDKTAQLFVEKEWRDGKKFAVTAEGEVEEIAETVAE